MIVPELDSSNAPWEKNIGNRAILLLLISDDGIYSDEAAERIDLAEIEHPNVLIHTETSIHSFSTQDVSARFASHH